jgi:hypothetical protein
MKNINKMIIIFGILLLSLIFLNPILTGKTINKYTYTKAICTEDNFCQDNIITCEDNNLKEIAPITGATIQHSKNWKDPRGKQTDNYCN